MLPQKFAALVEAPLLCGRVIAHSRNLYTIETDTINFRAELSGSLRYQTLDAQDLPVVGDYVSLRAHSDRLALIESVLPRTNLFARRAIFGSYELQPIAANLDTLFVTMAATRDFNVRRFERYFIAATAFGVEAALVLTKTDLIDDVAELINEVHSTMPNVTILPVSVMDRKGLESLEAFRGPDRTIAFVGSSGVGKSTLINELLGGDILAVNQVRAHDERGRHTTTARMLLHLPDGTAIIDTPGMREFALADASDGLGAAFSDVSELAAGCRFKDCRHKSEPGCAVINELDDERLETFRQLEREAAFEARKTDPRKAAEERKKWKTITKANRQRERW